MEIGSFCSLCLWVEGAMWGGHGIGSGDEMAGVGWGMVINAEIGCERKGRVMRRCCRKGLRGVEILEVH